ncbi:ATP-binding cassette domain-containing protein [Streptomyces sp. NPDC059819]|uniref:ATP-binding cassette domain-containing protein n=1 Tax=Streptomyces sp. NPDC059819 TaxID=3346963 RepID=UPI003668EEE2
MIETTGLVVRRGGHEYFGGLRLRVEDGESVRVAGPNGCGKSTLLAVLAGLCRPSAGSVRIAGRSPDDRAVRALRGFLQEPPPLYEHLTVHEHLALVGRLWSVRAGELGDRASELGLADRQDVLVGELSLGQRKKLGYVCATAHRPQLLLLDEPFNALDPAAVTAVTDDLRQRAQTGLTTVLVSHLDTAIDLVDRTLDLGALTPGPRDTGRTPGMEDAGDAA